MRRPYGPRSKRDQQLANNASHAYYAALTDKPPMLTVDVKPKRERGVAKADAPPKEHAEQVAVVKFWHLYSRTRGLHPYQLVAIPNAQMLLWAANNPNAAINYLLAEGMRKGCPDLMLFHARKRAPSANGLLIEMKRTTGGVVSDDQTAMIEILEKANYACAVCKGADAAIEVIKHYCDG